MHFDIIWVGGDIRHPVVGAMKAEEAATNVSSPVSHCDSTIALFIHSGQREIKRKD